MDPIETKTYWDYWEYQYSLLARAVLWAAGRDTGVRIASLQSSDGNAAVKFAIASDAPRQVEIEVAGRNEFGQPLGSQKFRKDLVAGQNSVEVSADALRPAAGWPGGRQIFNVIVRDAQTGATLNWVAATFRTPKRATMTMARPCRTPSGQRPSTTSSTRTSSGCTHSSTLT